MLFFFSLTSYYNHKNKEKHTYHLPPFYINSITTVNYITPKQQGNFYEEEPT